jgi:hypothetical protein
MDYATPQGTRRPGFLTAFLFSLPGLVGWYYLISVNLHSGLGRYFVPMLPIPDELGPVLWWAGMITAVASIVFFWKRPKPWYVVLCLVSNILGLLFTWGAIVYVLCARSC